ncbi:MAG: oxaloacetate decarboxylase [Acidobacteriales bacterium]|nr:oxaloacetate decarboxylase [Terriglobales bacterium]
MRKTTLLKQYILAPEILVIPGVPDPLCARIAEIEGFKALFLSGYASSAAYLGAPDVGLMTMTEMVDCARRIVNSVDLPVFVDGDNGHGNTTNVARTMREFERAGAAAIFFEDQVSPKRCGHMSGKQIVSEAEMAAKIKSACDARSDQDLIIMARTDALAIEGIDRAIERMHVYLAAGADMAFVEAPKSPEQMRKITSSIPAPNMANMVPGGRSPALSAAELAKLGFACVAHPTALSYVIARAARDLLHDLRETGSTLAAEPRMMRFEEFNRLLGLEEIRARELRFYNSK